MRKSIDHTVIIVDELPEAVERMARIGFHVRPIAHHIGVGSSNAVIHFPETYMELINVKEARQDLADLYQPRLADGEGLCHISLTSGGLVAETARLKQLGFAPGAVMKFAREVTMPDGAKDQTASSSVYNWHRDRPYLSLFFSEHPKPETIFIRDYANHPNGAGRLTRLAFMSEDPDGDLAYFEKSFGFSATRVDDDGFDLEGGRGDVAAVLTPEAAQARYGTLLAKDRPNATGGYPIAQHHSVRDIDRTRTFLREAGVAFDVFGSGLAIAAKDAAGSILVFEQES